ncbi:hypothetical protein GY45DRAFT_1330628 [Cubamyces sp. BRFM 1775]|nr:hypothetical protein GY45DRAFT_1330628 [Cubamyces sp. BRFM 1775]
MSSDGPPWFAYDPDGEIVYGGVPDRLLHHPEIRRRGIRLTDAIKPGIVFRAGLDEPAFVVKVLNTNTEEIRIYDKLLSRIRSPLNHTVPSEIYRDGHPLLIMPYLHNLTGFLLSEDRTPARLFDIFYQLAESLEYLHSLRIAHLDVCHDNFVAASPGDAESHPAVVSRRVYIIDFDTSRQLTLGPGAHSAITLPPTQIRPPDGLKHFDPYSWDVYCLGHVFEDLMGTYPFDGKRVPGIARYVARWLIGKERGCHAACRCRPTAWAARQVLSVIRLLAPVLDLCERAYLVVWSWLPASVHT